MSQQKILRLILGDQLNEKHSWFKNPDRHVTYVMMEIRQETDYVKHHIQKVAAFFTAMRAFAQRLGELGHRVIYLSLDDGKNQQTIDGNIANLLKKNNQISGDSEIAATVTLDAMLQDETGAVDLSRLGCRIDITHIGKEALDRLLVFLDPEGSNPTLSNARAQLKLANPSKVKIEIARGQLNLRIRFQGSLIPRFELNRVPIAKMKNIEKLTAAIPNWENLLPLLDMIGADNYSFTPEGKVVLR